MQFFSLGVVLWFLPAAQALISRHAAGDKMASPTSVPLEREMIRHFLGRLHRRSHPEVYNFSRFASKMNASLQIHHTTHLNHSNGSIETDPIFIYRVGKEDGWNNIDMARGDMCIDMLKEHGIKFDNKEKCIKFMDKECKVPSGQGLCQEWYSLLDGKPHIAKGAEAPSPANSGAPSPSGSKMWFHMDESIPTQEQGFSGEAVAHNNMVTQTSDWSAEYGPDSYADICAEHPDNLWCSLRGYRGRKPKKSPTQGDGESGGLDLQMLTMVIVLSAFIGLASVS